MMRVSLRAVPTCNQAHAGAIWEGAVMREGSPFAASLCW